MTLPDALELGATKDPKMLIKGEPAQVDADATAFTTESTRIKGLTDDVTAVTTPGWAGGHGEAAYTTARSAELDKWTTYTGLLADAGTAMSTYAGVLRTSQSRAADAITKYQQGEDATHAAVTAYNKQVKAHNDFVNKPVTVPSYGGRVPAAVGPPLPGPFVDPGDSLRTEAQHILDQARKALEDAGATALEKLGGLEGGKTEGSTHGPSASGSAEGPSFSWGDWDKTFGKNPAKGEGGRFDKGGSDSPFKINVGSVQGQASVWGADGSFEDYYGGAKVHADGSVTVLGVSGSAKASIGKDGVVIGADGRAVLASAKGSVGADWDHASIGADGEAYVGAEGKGEVLIGKTGAHADGELFAGARAEGSVQGEVGGVGAEGTGEAWAGVGASAKFDIGYDSGKFTIGGSGGLALGVGGKLGGEITIDPGEVIDTGKDIIKGIGGLFS